MSDAEDHLTTQLAKGALGWFFLAVAFVATCYLVVVFAPAGLQ